MTEEQKNASNEACEDNCEGKSLDELAGEGQIVTPDTDDEHGTMEVEIDREPPKDVIERCPQTEAEIMKPVDFKTGCFGMRGDIELVKSKCKNWLRHPEILSSPVELPTHLGRRSEMEANIFKAYRALEDAQMRIGKAIQAYDGGKSCYPR